MTRRGLSKQQNTTVANSGRANNSKATMEIKLNLSCGTDRDNYGKMKLGGGQNKRVLNASNRISKKQVGSTRDMRNPIVKDLTPQ